MNQTIFWIELLSRWDGVDGTRPYNCTRSSIIRETSKLLGHWTLQKWHPLIRILIIWRPRQQLWRKSNSCNPQVIDVGRKIWWSRSARWRKDYCWITKRQPRRVPLQFQQVVPRSQGAAKPQPFHAETHTPSRTNFLECKSMGNGTARAASITRNVARRQFK